MAGRARLNTPRAGARLLALLVVVLLLHAVALQWFARELAQPQRLKPLATPMFTRLLKPEAPTAVTPAPPAPPAAGARPKRSAITSIGKKSPRPEPEVASAASSPASASASASVPETMVPVTPQEAVSSTPEAATATLPVPVIAEASPADAASSAPAATAHSAVPSAAASVPGAAASPSAAASSPEVGPTASALDNWPGDTRLNYRLGGHFRGELQGTARVQWQREASRYQTRVEINLPFLATVVLTSQGEVTAQGLVPRVYEELRRSSPRGVRLNDSEIVLNNGRSVPRPAGVQDTASQFVELSHRFAMGKDVLEVGRTVSFWMARPGAVDLWTYDVVARDILQTQELGAIEAFHLKPRPIGNPRGNITAEMWFAPSLQYLPVRILVKMGEEAHVDLTVVNIEQR